MEEKYKTDKDKRFFDAVKYVKHRELILSDAQFAKAIGENAQSISDINRGKKSVSDKIITSLHKKYPYINKIYILDGSGNIETDTKDSDDPEESNVEMVLEDGKRIRVPVIPLDVSAGFLDTVDGSYSINNEAVFDYDWIEKYNDVKYDKLTVVFRVVGDSMYPHYKNKCKILCTWVDKSKWMYREGTHVISIKPNSLLLKKITGYKAGVFTLSSANESYQDKDVIIDDILAMWKVEYKTYEPGE